MEIKFNLDGMQQETERIYLRKIDSNDLFEPFHNYSLQKEIYTHLEFSPFKNRKDTKRYLEKLINRVNTGKADYRFLILKGSYDLIGLFGFHSFDNYRLSIEFGYGISPLMQRKGYFKEVSNHMICYLFNNLNIHRIYAYTSIQNKSSLKGLVSIGFEKKGVLKDFYLKDGKYFDAAIFTLLNKN